MKLYFAGPVFGIAEKTFNASFTKKIEDTGISVFLPQRDGEEIQLNNSQHIDDELRKKIIFQKDYTEIINSDIFLFILDGRVPDESAAFELGVAFAQKELENQNKILIGLHTDSRASFDEIELTPMISLSLDFIFTETKELLGYLQSIATA